MNLLDRNPPSSICTVVHLPFTSLGAVTALQPHYTGPTEAALDVFPALDLPESALKLFHPQLA